jgi:hypothetical protein
MVEQKYNPKTSDKPKIKQFNVLVVDDEEY